MSLIHVVIACFINICFSAMVDISNVVSKAGTTTAMNWININVDARSGGMGQSQVASDEGLSSVHYNPASIVFIGDTQLYGSYSEYFGGMTYSTMAYGARLSSSEFFALHIFSMSSDDIAITTEYQPDETGEFFQMKGICFRGTYAKAMTDRLKLGISFKYLKESIYTHNMTAVAFDMGVNFKIVNELLLGFSMTNFGPAVDYGSNSFYNTSLNRRFYLPKQIRLGIENSFPIDKQNQMIFAFDVMNTINDTVAKNIGVEYIWNQMAFLRIGKTNSGNPTIGLGIKIGGVRIDLAKMQNAALGDINYISFLLN